MIQTALLDIKAPAPVDDDDRRRALEGLPHYWKISWGWTDRIVADCGVHMFITRVDWLEDPDQQIITRCHYKELGLCPEVKHG